MSEIPDLKEVDLPLGKYFYPGVVFFAAGIAVLGSSFLTDDGLPVVFRAYGGPFALIACAVGGVIISKSKPVLAMRSMALAGALIMAKPFLAPVTFGTGTAQTVYPYLSWPHNPYVYSGALLMAFTLFFWIRWRVRVKKIQAGSR